MNNSPASHDEFYLGLLSIFDLGGALHLSGAPRKPTDDLAQLASDETRLAQDYTKVYEQLWGEFGNLLKEPNEKR